MARSKVSEAIQAQARQRARNLCEYCHASEKWQYVRFTVDHVIPLDQDGADDIDNLAIACFHCNRRKSNRLTGVDPIDIVDIAKVPLFNPRHDQWIEHFIWSADTLYILALTSTGRATIAALDLNRDRVINIRVADREIGRHPPLEDPVQKATFSS